MGMLYQVLATIILCNQCLIMGVMFAWPSCTLKIFESADTTLHRPMGETELALFGSLSSIGALISTPIAGYLLDKIGRKYCAVTVSLANVIAWGLIAVCNRVEVILAAICISGFGGAVFLNVPVYVSEICQESIRGTATAGAMIFYCLGLLTSYLMGGLLDYKLMIYVCLTLSVIFVVSLGLLKESPVYLMKIGREKEAMESIAFYRRVKPDSKVVQHEMDTLQRAFNPNLDDDTDAIVDEEQKLKPLEKPKEKLSLWEFFNKSRSTRRAMLVTITLMTASIFQGLVVVQVYAEPLFEEAVPNMSATISSVLLAIIMVVVGGLSAYLTDVAGRRPLMIYASAAAGLFCVVLGTQLHLHWGPHWLTAVCIYLFCTTYTLGAGTVPYVLVPEVFLPEVKSFMSMMVVEWAWLCNFIILFIFSPLVTAMGLGPVFYLFSAVCFLTCIFSYVYQPETSGLPVDVIQNLFMGRKRY